MQGVGAKVALSVLGTLTMAELGARLIAMRDKAWCRRSPGVGAKVAERKAKKHVFCEKPFGVDATGCAAS